MRWPHITPPPGLTRTPKRPPRVVNYHGHRVWGHDFTISRVTGMSISGHLWVAGALAVGDLLVLPGDDPAQRSTYELTRVERYHDPSDMFRYEAKHAPHRHNEVDQ